MRWAALLLACGGCGGDEARFGMSVSGLSADMVGELQVSVLTDRRTVDCGAVMQGCVKDLFPASRFVPLTAASGATHTALRFSRDAGIEVRMSPARDLAVVIEALTIDTPPKLAASSCTYVMEITSGSNRVQATPIVLPDGGATAACDPTL